MDNLLKIRKLANVNPKILSKLLNVTVHTYLAFEQEKMVISFELIKMLSLIFRIDEKKIIDSSNQLEKQDKEQLIKISSLSEEEKLHYLALGILGEGVKINYKNISKVKNKIKNGIKN